jgi:hypothetical protein
LQQNYTQTEQGDVSANVDLAHILSSYKTLKYFSTKNKYIYTEKWHNKSKENKKKMNLGAV